MYWSTDDHHRQQQHNYYNSLQQSVQHQNGLQQATAAVPPHQQQHATQPPTIQQQQQHQQQQQQQQHRSAQQIQSHFANQQQFQQHPQQQQQQQHHHQHQQWAPRPAPILTVPPFIPQYSNNVPNTTQFCAPPPNYYPPPQQQYTQASAVSAAAAAAAAAAASQQRQCLPQGCTVYSMPPPATALRQNVITQPPPNILTPTTSAAAQQMQVQFFTSPQFCQPPPLGQQTYGSHIMTPTLLTDQQIVKPRKYAIPIIDPITNENVLERKFRSNESPDADSVSSITTTPSSTSIDEYKEPINYVKEEYQSIEQQLLPQQEQMMTQEEEYVEDVTDAIPQPAVLDHVEAIEPEEDVKEDVGYFMGDEFKKVEGFVKNTATLPLPPSPQPHEEIEEDIDQTQDTIPTTTAPIITNDKQVDDDAAPSSSSFNQGNMCAPPPPPPLRGNEESSSEDKSSLQIKTETEESPPNEVAPSDAKATAAAAGKQNKKQQTPPPPTVDDDATATLTQPPPPPTTTTTTTTTATKLPSKKTKRNSKRLKESQKKQKADLIKSENNNTNKATNQNENNKAKQKEKLSDPSNSSTATTTNRLKTKAKETTKSRSNSSTKTESTTATPADIEAENTIAVSSITATTAAVEEEEVAATVATTTTTTTTATAATSVDAFDKSEESSLQVDDSAETLTNYDENDHSASLHLHHNPKLSTTEEIKLKIFGIEPTKNDETTELLFLNSSVSEEMEDFTLQDEGECKIIHDILFGDFSQTENIPQDLITEDAAVNEEESKLKPEAEDEEDINEKEANTVSEEFKEKKYTLEQLKSLAKEPASKVPPAFRGQICEKIGKNPRDGPAVQHQQIYQQMSYKDSINLNRKRNKRDMMPSPHQQFNQQHQQQQYDNQQQQQRNPDIIRVYLSLNEDIQLAESENAWVPPTLKNFGPKNAEDDETILKKIRGILNKLTPENFDKLLYNASMFPINSVERINKVMLLIFEKTLREPDFAPTYARFCKFLFNPDDSNNAAFKTILVTRIQDEFSSNVNNAKAKEAKLRPLMDKMAAATDPKEKLEIKAEIDDQEYQFRRRAWGTVRFIAEMCKLGFISTVRACICVEDLLDVRCEEKLEYMCKLLSTVGPQLEWAHKDRGYEKKWEIKERLDKIFTKIRQVVEKKNGAGQKISSRVRFMMQDIIDLRARSWDVGKDNASNNVLPSREVSPAYTGGRQSNQQQQQQQRGGGSRNYMPSMSGSSGGYDKKRQHGNEAQQKTTSIDKNKLLLNFNSDDIKLGCSSPLMWQISSKPKSSPVNVIHQPNREQNHPRSSSPPKQQDLSKGECECHLNRLIEMVAEGEEPSEWFNKWSSISKPHHACIIDYVLSTYLHSKECELNHCTKLFTSLFREKLITRQTFSEGYNKFSQFWDDTLMDLPKGWDTVFRFLSPLLHHELLAFDAIWDKKWFDTQCGCKFVKSMIVHFTSEFGANYMRYFWDNHFLEWSMFLPEDKIQSFITTNQFEFIENHKCVPPMFIHRTADQLVQRIKELLAQSSQGGNDLIIDFISTNVRIDCNFIRSLTMFLCDYTVIQIPNKNSSNSTKSKSKSSSDNGSSSSSSSASPSYKVRQDVFVQKCIPLLRRCIDSNDEYELTCLNAIVAGCDNLDYDKFPTDLICSILIELYGEVISKESFEKWREQLAADVEGNISKELDAFLKTLPI